MTTENSTNVYLNLILKSYNQDVVTITGSQTRYCFILLEHRKFTIFASNLTNKSNRFLQCKKISIFAFTRII